MTEAFYFLKQSKYRSGDKTCIIFVRLQIFEKSILLLFAFRIFRYRILPITTEHRMSLTRAGLSIGKYCKIVAFGYFGYVLCE